MGRIVSQLASNNMSRPGFAPGFGNPGNDYGGPPNRPIPGYSQPGVVPSMPIIPPGFGNPGNDYGGPSNRPIPFPIYGSAPQLGSQQQPVGIGQMPVGIGQVPPHLARQMPVAGQPGWQPNMPMIPNLPYNPTMMDDFGRQGGAMGQAGGFGNAPSFGSSVGVLSGGGMSQPTYGNGAQLGSMMGSYNNPGYQQSIMSLFNNLFGGRNTYMR